MLKLLYFTMYKANRVAIFITGIMDINIDKPPYSIVMPVFQSAAYLETNVARVVAVMDALGAGYEIILVDDDSTDGTWDILLKLKATTPHLRVFRLARNVGQTPATYAGALQAKGAYIITLDDDLQHPPEEIPKLIAAIKQNPVDVVFGNPENRYHAYKQHPALVWFGKFLFHQVFMRRYRKLHFFTTFRLFKASMLRQNGGPWSHLFFIWQLDPSRAMHIPTKHKGRQQGQTNHTFTKLVRHFAPFLLYFGLRTMVVLQVLVALGAVAYILQLQYASNVFSFWPQVIVAIALVVTVVKRLLKAQLNSMEHTTQSVIEG